MCRFEIIGENLLPPTTKQSPRRGGPTPPPSPREEDEGLVKRGREKSGEILFVSFFFIFFLFARCANEDDAAGRSATG